MNQLATRMRTIGQELAEFLATVLLKHHTEDHFSTRWTTGRATEPAWDVKYDHQLRQIERREARKEARA